MIFNVIKLLEYPRTAAHPSKRRKQTNEKMKQREAESIYASVTGHEKMLIPFWPTIPPV